MRYFWMLCLWTNGSNALDSIEKHQWGWAVVHLLMGAIFVTCLDLELYNRRLSE